jgi:hypothetical protein
VPDLGAPISYLLLERGSPVFAADGQRVGEVAEVRADENADIFDSIVIERGLLGGERHLVGADHVAEIHERGVQLSIEAAAFEALRESG